PTTISSTIVVRHGTSSSISLGASCPSDCANGPTGSDQWDLVLAKYELRRMLSPKRELSSSTDSAVAGICRPIRPSPGCPLGENRLAERVAAQPVEVRPK